MSALKAEGKLAGFLKSVPWKKKRMIIEHEPKLRQTSADNGKACVILAYDLLESASPGCSPDASLPW